MSPPVRGRGALGESAVVATDKYGFCPFFGLGPPKPDSLLRWGSSQLAILPARPPLLQSCWRVYKYLLLLVNRRREVKSAGQANSVKVHRQHAACDTLLRKVSLIDSRCLRLLPLWGTMAGAGVPSAAAQLVSRHRAAFLCAAGVGLALAAAWLWGKGRRRSRRELQQVGVVAQLFIYPVKSLRGVSLQEAECTKLGLKHGHLRDRHWAVIKQDGRIVSGREDPKLVLISVSSEGGFLTLTAPDMEKLCIPLKQPRTNPVWNCRNLGHAVQGKDCGDEASKWINAYLKRSEPYRVVQFEPHMKLRDSITEFPLYTRDDKTAYSDLSPILLLSEASLDDLNSKLDKKVKMRNFRPCIVVSGCDAFDEDSWDDIIIGNVELNRVMPCPRCIFTTVDPDTGVADIKEPLNTLRSYRRCQTEDKKYYDSPPLHKSPLFGQFYGIERIGTLKVGDPVYKIIS